MSVAATNAVSATSTSVGAYQQTDIGVLPSDWLTTRIGDMTTKVGSGITPTGGSKVYLSSGRPFVRSQNVGWGTLFLDDLAFISDETHETFDSTELREDDVLLNITGASIGRCAVGDSRLARGNVNQHVCIIRVDHNLYNARFLAYVLLSRIGQGQIDSFQAGGNRQGLNFAQVRSIVCPIPSTKREQDAIAEALSDADALIESLESLIAKKRAIKQGAMQELLSGHRRLPGFKGDWSPAPLGNLGLWVGGGTPSMAREDYWTNGTIPWTSSADIRLGEMTGELRCVTELAISESSARLVPKHSVVIVTRSGILRRFLPVCLLTKPVAINQDIKALIPNKPSIGGFVTQSLIYHNEAILASCLKAGTTVESIELDWLKKFEIQIPPTDEEIQKVCAVLDEFDADIRAVERKLHKARQIKQGMMQELLTGRIRLL